jgi:hypothetical protein
MQIYLADDGILVDDIIFETLQDDGSWVEQNIRSYQFMANGKKYNLGEKLIARGMELSFSQIN